MHIFQELLHLGYQKWNPDSTLRPWVQCIWSVNGKLGCTPVSERVYPDGGSSLVFDFGRGEEPSIYFYALQTTQAIHINSSLMGVRFEPCGAKKLLGLPVDLLENRAYSFQELGLNSLVEVYSKLRSHPVLRRKDILHSWLLTLAAEKQIAVGPLECALTTIYRNPGTVENLAASFAVSKRTLERHFKLQTGLSIGQYGYLTRIRKARLTIKSHPDCVLTNVAVDTGFYDQAHFIHCFKKVTGYTPAAYRLRQQQHLQEGRMRIDRSTLR